MKPDEQLVLFQTSVQDIRDLKANQWRFSNYGLLIQAALVAADNQLESTPGWIVELVLTALSLGACSMIGWLICEAQQQIVRRRRFLDDLSFPRNGTMLATRYIFGPKGQPAPSRPWEDARLFALLFFSTQIIAAGLAIWVILAGGP